MNLTIFNALLISSAVGYSFQCIAAEGDKNKHSSKAEIQCLYDIVDTYLSEPVDPVIILLPNICAKPEIPSGSGTGIKSNLPTLSLPVNPETPSLTEDDILIVSKEQLNCFKKNFEQLIDQSSAIKTIFNAQCPE